MTTVPDRLAKLGGLFNSRNLTYGDAYKRFGPIMANMFPDGVTLKTEEDFNRFGILIHLIGKMTRYAASFDGEGHSDSLDDISVYAQMLQELDDEQ